MDLDKLRREAQAFEKFANVKKLISTYYEKTEQVEKLREAIVSQIEQIKVFDIELPEIIFP